MKAGRARRARLECGRCGTRAPRDWSSAEAEDWSGRYEGGRLVLIVCPPCHTPVETAQAKLNAAAVTIGTEAGGRFAADPVLCLTGTRAVPGTVLYGRDHLQRIVLDGPVDGLAVVEELPVGTRCVPTVGGVMIYPPPACA